MPPILSSTNVMDQEKITNLTIRIILKNDSSKKHSSSMHGETAVALNEMEVGRIRDEHEKTLGEERSQKCWLCLVVVACVLVAMVLLGVVLVDRFVVKPTKGFQMTGGVPIFSKDGNDSSSADKAEANLAREEAIRAKIRKMLVNLTESCMALEPQGCFYHKNRYPDNCKKTKCNSIIVKLNIS
uniref:Uncharacterized protein n=1 Tax=Romanomermis culicivorax TaxID=13658 RepID=A0A915IW07_ROMCU